MSFLQSRLSQQNEPGAPAAELQPAETDLTLAEFARDREQVSDSELELKARIHDELISMLDVSRLFEVSRDQAARDVSQAGRQLLDVGGGGRPQRERERIVDEIVDWRRQETTVC